MAETERYIVHEFRQFTAWQQTYDRLIELGKALPHMKDEYKTEANQIKGCQSVVWLVGEMREGRVWFIADSDSVIVKGILALLLRVVSGQKPDDILTARLNFITTIGLKQHLSPSRSNGLAYIIARIRSIAIKYRQIQQDQ